MKISNISLYNITHNHCTLHIPSTAPVLCMLFVLIVIVLCTISLTFHLLFGPRAASLLLNGLIDWLIDWLVIKLEKYRLAMALSIVIGIVRPLRPFDTQVMSETIYGSTNSVIALKDNGWSTRSRANPIKLSSLKGKQKMALRRGAYIYSEVWCA